MIPAIYRLAFIAACYVVPDWKKVEDISKLKPLTYVKDATLLIGKYHSVYQLDKYCTKQDIQWVLSQGQVSQNSYMIPNIERTEECVIINKGDVSSFIVIEHGMDNLLMVNDLLKTSGMIIFNNGMLIVNTDYDMPSRYINVTIDTIRRYKK